MIIRLQVIYEFRRKADVHKLCIREYPGHMRSRSSLGGCPNFGRKDGCPPGRPLLHEAFCLAMPCYLVINRFDIRSHALCMRARHPDWSERQIYNCLYWQGTARMRLKHAIKDALAEIGSEYKVETVPESMGMDVTATCRHHGLELEWPPRQWAHQVAFVGIPLIAQERTR